MRRSVAPLAGAWIEIFQSIIAVFEFAVAPLAGAWIEIPITVISGCIYTVAPLAGAWIEINSLVENRPTTFCRSPCGSVD